MYLTSKQKFTQTTKINKTNKNPKMSPKKALLIGIVLVVLAIATLVLLEKTGVTNFYERSQPSSPTPTEPQPRINLDPPTEEEAAAGDQKKDEIVQQEQEEDGAPDPATKTSVTIVDASQYDTEIEVRAFASSIKDGTCVITFEQAGQVKIVKSVPAYADASSSPCIALTLPRSEFPTAGKWHVTVEYSSEGLEGSAETSLQLQ